MAIVRLPLRPAALTLALHLFTFDAMAEELPSVPPAPAPGAEPSATAATEFPAPGDELRTMRVREPILVVAEGLDGLTDLATVRARLSEMFQRPVLSLGDADAKNTVATVWISVGAQELVLRLSGQGRPDRWQRVSRSKLADDPVNAIVQAVLDILWSERMEEHTASEVVDPFCPAGLICQDGLPRRGRTRRHTADSTVLDPWDGAYQRFAPLDPVPESPRYHQRGEPFEDPSSSGDVVPGSDLQASRPVITPRPEAQSWGLGLLAGGGVHGEGGFARYEVDLLRRFPRFDLGLSFIGGRGQPDPAKYVNRAVAALLQRRFVMPGLEVDLGTNFGLMVRQREGSEDVRPYLRGLLAFGVALSQTVTVVLQNEVGTTFDDVSKAGGLEYALSLGVRVGL